jgi:hypothetical protein
MMKYFAIALSIILLTISVDLAQGYEVVEIKNGATLKGTVSFKGGIPQDERIVINKDIEHCGKEQKVGKYVITDSKIKNVVVWLEGVKEGKAIPQEPVPITIKNCMAVPHVSIGFVGGEYIFRNDDKILHTTQLKLELAYQRLVSRRPLKDGATIYNLALPKKGVEIRKPIKWWHRYSEDTGVIQVRSNTHNWIRGYIFIFDHPYAAVTNEKGEFVIDRLPPGEYLLKAWHEGFGVEEKKIKVTSGETAEVRIAFAK